MRHCGQSSSIPMINAAFFVEQLLTYIFFNSICRVSSRDDHEGLQELGKIVNYPNNYLYVSYKLNHIS